MKRKSATIIWVMGLIILIIFSLMFIYLNSDNKKIQIENDIFEIYDESIKNIKKNMDTITESNNDFTWWILKDFAIDDKEYEKTLNALVADVRMCYLEYTDEGDMYTDSNPIRKYRERKYITRTELEQLNIAMKEEFLSGNITRFDTYQTLLISENDELRAKVLEQTNKITKLKLIKTFMNTNLTYNELLLKKVLEVRYVEDISDFLVNEYNRLK